MTHTSEAPTKPSTSWLKPENARWATAIAFVLVAVLWIFFAAEEPLHIDELRQLSGYSGGISQWLSKSWELNQPPLEIMLGGTWRLVLGSTDFVERLLPTLFGLGSLGLLAHLSVIFAGNRFAAPFTILAYGLSPVVLRTTAYIRPYAIPTFFALLFLVVLRRLLRKEPSIGTVGLAIAASIGLLLTHALVPLLISVVTLISLLARRFIAHRSDPGTVPALMVTSSLAFVSLAAPIITRIKNPSYFDTQIDYGFVQRLVDGIEAIWVSYRGAFGVAGIALVVVLVLLFTKTFRPASGEIWWFIPLLAISPGISAIFLSTVAPGFSFFDRYFHDLLLPGAIAVGLVGSRALNMLPEFRRHRLAILTASLAVILYFSATIVAFQNEVTTQRNTDWAKGADIVMENTVPGTTVLFEFMNPFPRYQPLFYGQPRYLPTSYSIQHPRIIVTSGDELEDAPIAVLLTGSARIAVEPDGWQIIDEAGWRLLIPPAGIATDASAVLDVLDESIGDDRLDVAIRLSHAIELARIGEFDRANIVLHSITPPDVADPQLIFQKYWDAAQALIADLESGS